MALHAPEGPDSYPAEVRHRIRSDVRGDYIATARALNASGVEVVSIVPGTLSYAMGAGKAIVSTPYAYAAEMLGDGRGRLVEPGSPAALADAFIELLRDGDLRAKLGRRAYRHSRAMLWPEVGSRYRAIFARVAAAGAPAARVRPVWAARV